MKITKLECENFAGLPDGTYSFLAPDRATPNELTLIAGVRGAGKTRLLEAIVALKELVGSYRSPPPRASLLDPAATSGRLGGTFLLSEEERDAAELEANELTVDFEIGPKTGDRARIERPVRALFERYSHDPARGKVEYFPASRWLPLFGETTTADQERLVRLGSHHAKYGGLVPSLIALSLADGAAVLRDAARVGLLLDFEVPDSLATFRAAITKLLPELQLRGANAGDGARPTLLFDRPDGSTVDVHRLSEAQKQAVLLAGTLVRLGLSGSIVLLDGPELHLHAADQGRFLQALLTIGTDNQWIVATGSSEIMKSARREQVIALPSPRAAAPRG